MLMWASLIIKTIQGANYYGTKTSCTIFLAGATENGKRSVGIG